MTNPSHRIDVEKLTDYLEGSLESFAGPVQLEKFAGGQSNPTFLLTTPNQRFVLRRKPPGQLLESAHAVDREFRVLKALENSSVPVAKPYVLCKDNTIIGSMFYVMSFEPGRIFWDPALPEMNPKQRGLIFEELIRVLATLHDVDTNTVGLADYGRPGNYFERQLGRWTKQYHAAETEHITEMGSLIEWLDQNIPDDDGQVSLIHGDFRLDNIMFHPEEPQAMAILDWELSTLGHPMADLAYFCMCLRRPAGKFHGLAGLDLQSLGIPTEDDIIRRYCQLRNIEQPEHWTFYLAFSFFRLAAIAQGVFKRSLDGNASSDEAKQAGAFVPALAQMAMDVVNKEGQA